MSVLTSGVRSAAQRIANTPAISHSGSGVVELSSVSGGTTGFAIS